MDVYLDSFSELETIIQDIVLDLEQFTEFSIEAISAFDERLKALGNVLAEHGLREVNLSLQHHCRTVRNVPSAVALFLIAGKLMQESNQSARPLKEIVLEETLRLLDVVFRRIPVQKMSQASFLYIIKYYEQVLHETSRKVLPSTVLSVSSSIARSILSFIDIFEARFWSIDSLQFFQQLAHNLLELLPRDLEFDLFRSLDYLHSFSIQTSVTNQVQTNHSYLLTVLAWNHSFVKYSDPYCTPQIPSFIYPYVNPHQFKDNAGSVDLAKGPSAFLNTFSSTEAELVEHCQGDSRNQDETSRSDDDESLRNPLTHPSLMLQNICFLSVFSVLMDLFLPTLQILTGKGQASPSFFSITPQLYSPQELFRLLLFPLASILHTSNDYVSLTVPSSSNSLRLFTLLFASSNAPTIPTHSTASHLTDAAATPDIQNTSHAPYLSATLLSASDLSHRNCINSYSLNLLYFLLYRVHSAPLSTASTVPYSRASNLLEFPIPYHFRSLQQRNRPNHAPLFFALPDCLHPSLPFHAFSHPSTQPYIHLQPSTSASEMERHIQKWNLEIKREDSALFIRDIFATTSNHIRPSSTSAIHTNTYRILHLEPSNRSAAIPPPFLPYCFRKEARTFPYPLSLSFLEHEHVSIPYSGKATPLPLASNSLPNSPSNNVPITMFRSIAHLQALPDTTTTPYFALLHALLHATAANPPTQPIHPVLQASFHLTLAALMPDAQMELCVDLLRVQMHSGVASHVLDYVRGLLSNMWQQSRSQYTDTARLKDTSAHSNHRQSLPNSPLMHTLFCVAIATAIEYRVQQGMLAPPKDASFPEKALDGSSISLSLVPPPLPPPSASNSSDPTTIPFVSQESYQWWYDASEHMESFEQFDLSLLSLLRLYSLIAVNKGPSLPNDRPPATLIAHLFDVFLAPLASMCTKVQQFSSQLLKDSEREIVPIAPTKGTSSKVNKQVHHQREKYLRFLSTVHLRQALLPEVESGLQALWQ